MKEEDWTNLSATLEQISRLQPNFVSVWSFQGWNLSYNVSVEFDDYHDRYRWVIKGIEFLKKGTEYNKDEPRLLTDIGWTIGHKIGTADEHVQYRRLFREDDEFNVSRPLAQRDNWLVGREWLGKAEEVVGRGVPVKGNTPLLFYSRPAMCLIKYAEALEEEGRFGEVAKNAWLKAADVWTEFGNRDLPTQFGAFIRLSDKEEFDRKASEASAEIERLARRSARAVEGRTTGCARRKKRKAYDTPPARRSREQEQLVYQVDARLRVSDLDVAEHVTGDEHARVFQLAEEATEAENIARAIDNDREIVNFKSWALRCRFEPEDETLAARKAMYDGDKAFLAAQLPPAGEFYVDGINSWRKVLDKYPELLNDSLIVEDLMTSINRYRSILHHLSEDFPKPFVLQDVVDVDARSKAPPVPAANAGAEGDEPKVESSQPADRQPGDQNQVDQKPAEEKPAEEKPGAETPGDGAASETKPAEK